MDEATVVVPDVVRISTPVSKDIRLPTPEPETTDSVDKLLKRIRESKLEASRKRVRVSFTKMHEMQTKQTAQKEAVDARGTTGQALTQTELQQRVEQGIAVLRQERERLQKAGITGEEASKRLRETAKDYTGIGTPSQETQEQQRNVAFVDKLHEIATQKQRDGRLEQPSAVDMAATRSQQKAIAQQEEAARTAKTAQEEAERTRIRAARGQQADAAFLQKVSALAGERSTNQLQDPAHLARERTTPSREEPAQEPKPTKSVLARIGSWFRREKSPEPTPPALGTADPAPLEIVRPPVENPHLARFNRATAPPRESRTSGNPLPAASEPRTVIPEAPKKTTEPLHDYLTSDHSFDEVSENTSFVEDPRKQPEDGLGYIKDPVFYPVAEIAVDAGKEGLFGLVEGKVASERNANDQGELTTSADNVTQDVVDDARIRLMWAIREQNEPASLEAGVEAAVAQTLLEMKAKHGVTPDVVLSYIHDGTLLSITSGEKAMRLITRGGAVIDTGSGPVSDISQLVVAGDAVWGKITPDELAEIVQNSRDNKDMGRLIQEKAIRRGADGNTSVLISDVADHNIRQVRSTRIPEELTQEMQADVADVGTAA